MAALLPVMLGRQARVTQPSGRVGVDPLFAHADSVVAAVTALHDAKGADVSAAGVPTVFTPKGVLIGTFNSAAYVAVDAPKTYPPFSVFFDLLYGSALGAQAFVSFGGAGAGGGWSVNSAGGNPGAFRLTFGGVADYSASAAVLSHGVLYRLGVVVTGNGGTAKYFVNGLLESSRAVGTATTAATNMLLGAAYSTAIISLLNGGALGNVTLFNKALDDKQVLDEFASQFAVHRKMPTPRLISLPIGPFVYARPTADVALGDWVGV